MNRFLLVLLATAVLSCAQEEPAAKDLRVYLIGNSLTWDTLPSKLSGKVAWHVDCGKPLTYIFEHPAKPCVGSSSVWTNALHKRTFDIISFQPHYRSTLEENIKVISTWCELQPDAEVVLHSGWARAVDRAREWESERGSGTVIHNRAWFQTLVKRLEEKFPDREFRQSHAQDLLAMVESDIQAGTAPFDEMPDLYRDAIHMNNAGRYLMHNAMRHALGQARSGAGLKFEAAHKTYLDSVLDRHQAK